MYRIVETLDGKFRTLCNIQDGTEREIFDDLTNAFQYLINSAKTFNGTDITIMDIKMGHETQVIKTEVTWEEIKCSCKCLKCRV